MITVMLLGKISNASRRSTRITCSYRPATCEGGDYILALASGLLASHLIKQSTQPSHSHKHAAHLADIKFLMPHDIDDRYESTAKCTTSVNMFCTVASKPITLMTSRLIAESNCHIAAHMREHKVSQPAGGASHKSPGTQTTGSRSFHQRYA